MGQAGREAPSSSPPGQGSYAGWDSEHLDPGHKGEVIGFFFFNESFTLPLAFVDF